MICSLAGSLMSSCRLKVKRVLLGGDGELDLPARVKFRRRETIAAAGSHDFPRKGPARREGQGEKSRTGLRHIVGVQEEAVESSLFRKESIVIEVDRVGGRENAAGVLGIGTDGIGAGVKSNAGGPVAPRVARRGERPVAAVHSKINATTGTLSLTVPVTTRTASPTLWPDLGEAKVSLDCPSPAACKRR